MRNIAITISIIGSIALIVGLWIYTKPGDILEANDPQNSRIGDTISPLEDHGETTSVAPDGIESSQSLEQMSYIERLRESLPGSVREKSPYQRYKENIALAEGGIARAQYEVSRALGECALSPRPEKLAELEKAQTLNQTLLDHERLASEWCRDLHGLFDHEETKNRAEMWLREAVNNNDPLALVLNSLSGEADYNDRRNLPFREAFQIGSEDIYKTMMLYHAMYNETDQLEYQAWNFFVCNQTPTCSTEEIAEVLEAGEYGYKVETIVGRVAEISRAMKNEDWDKVIPPF